MGTVQRMPMVVPSDRVYPPPRDRPAPAGSSSESHAATFPGSPPPLVAPENLVLILSAREATWVAVQADGRVVLNRVLNEGESETLEAHGELVLSVGNAGGVAFRLNDRPGRPLGRSGEVRRNIVITRQSLPSLVQDAPSARGSRG